MATDVPTFVAPPDTVTSAPATESTLNAKELGTVLEELIAALDRRVPRVEQAGEAAIARDAAALRAKAVARLAELASGSGDVERPSE